MNPRPAVATIRGGQSSAPSVALALLAMLVLPACDLMPADRVTERDPSAPFQTSALHYDFDVVPLGIEVVIPYRFLNPGPEALVLQNCPGRLGFVIERHEEQGWTPVWPSPPSLRQRDAEACDPAPVIVEAGAELRDSIVLFAGRNGEEVYPHFGADSFQGEYRVVWLNLSTQSNDHGVEEGLRRSNRFSLSGPPGYP